MQFTINPYYRTNKSEYRDKDIESALNLAEELINLNKVDPSEIATSRFELIGEGNDDTGRVYSLVGTNFCLKIADLGKHVGRNQERQFGLNEHCMTAVKGKSVQIEGNDYQLTTTRSVAVAADDLFSYTLMVRLDNTLRLWD